jgi:hypothetical protein
VKIDTNDLTNAAYVVPDGPEQWVVVWGHSTLDAGNIVVIRDHKAGNVAVRLPELTVHPLTDIDGQYIMLVRKEVAG